MDFPALEGYGYNSRCVHVCTTETSTTIGNTWEKVLLSWTMFRKALCMSAQHTQTVDFLSCFSALTDCWLWPSNVTLWGHRAEQIFLILTRAQRRKRRWLGPLRHTAICHVYTSSAASSAQEDHFFKEAGHFELAKTWCKHLMSNKLSYEAYWQGRLDAADLDHRHDSMSFQSHMLTKARLVTLTTSVSVSLTSAI